jgi:hypothetical protein
MKKNPQFSFAKVVLTSIVVLVILSLLLIYSFIFTNSKRVTSIKNGSFEIGFDIKGQEPIVKVTLPEVTLNPDTSITTTTISVIDKETKEKIVTFEIDFVPGKYRWVCNDFKNLKNYLDGKVYICSDVLKKYFDEKLNYKKDGSRNLQAVLAVGMASQEGLIDEQEQLSNRRASSLYDEMNEYLDSLKMNIPRIKVSFGKYTGPSTDKCGERTDEQRIVAFIRVYDSNVAINDDTYESFKKMFYVVYKTALKEDKIQLNGFEYSKFQQEKIFLERKFL